MNINRRACLSRARSGVGCVASFVSCPLTGCRNTGLVIHDGGENRDRRSVISTPRSSTARGDRAGIIATGSVALTVRLWLPSDKLRGTGNVNYAVFAYLGCAKRRTRYQNGGRAGFASSVRY